MKSNHKHFWVSINSPTIVLAFLFLEICTTRTAASTVLCGNCFSKAIQYLPVNVASAYRQNSSLILGGKNGLVATQSGPLPCSVIPVV